MRTVLHLLSEAIQDGKCEALVIGGFALEAYGFQRPTHDIDLLVATLKIRPVEDLLQSAGYHCLGRNNICARFSHSDPLLFPVDLLFVNDPTWDKFWAKSESTTIEGAALRVPHPAHIIALKLHAMHNEPTGRKNDFGDIVRILTHRPEAVSMEELKALCERYTSLAMYHQLLTALRHAN
jgi:Uncharacterised nucleotidyltransferase